MPEQGQKSKITYRDDGMSIVDQIRHKSGETDKAENVAEKPLTQTPDIKVSIEEPMAENELPAQPEVVVEQIMHQTETEPVIEKPKDEGLLIIEQLRGKTEEGDLDQYLKKSFGGGYTRDSVAEYFGNMRRQQQISAETFYKNMQFLYDEKEALKKANEKLRERLTKVEADYENFSQTILLNKMEGTDFTVNDVLNLKSRVAALEDILKKSSSETRLLNNKIDHLEKANEDLQTQLQQANEETNTQRRLVVSEKQETKKQSDAASDYLAQLEAERDQNRYLTSLVETGELAKLKLKIEDLTGQMVSLNEVNDRLVAENDSKDRRAETLVDQIESLNKTLKSLTGNIDELSIQNAKLVNANKALTFQLEAEFQKTIGLIKERSDINTEKISFMNQLSEAKMRMNLLEQTYGKDRHIEEIGEAYRNLNALDSESIQEEATVFEESK